jgi:hypothetical protein
MATYYVRKTGSDANNGTTIPLAKLTIAGAVALSAAGSGDTIDIGVGEWIENIIYSNARTYRGAGMFLTSIVGRLTNGSAAVSIYFRDLKMTLNANNTATISVSLLSLVRVYWNCAGYGDTGGDGYFSASWVLDNSLFVNLGVDKTCSTAYTITNSIFTSNNNFETRYVTLASIVKNSFISVYNLYRPDSTNPTHSYNAYAGTPSWGLGTGEFIASLAACFVDAPNGDFTLKAGSPLINTGNP